DPTGKCFWDMCFTEGAIIATGINLLGMIAVKILGNELSKTIVPPDDSSNTQSASISQTQSQAQSQSQAKSEEKTEEEYVTVYRGDYSGKNGFLAKGIENGIESVFNEGTLDQQVERHTENSDYSPFVSVTADPNVAKDYATNYEEHNGSIYTLRISKDRLIPVPGSKNGEFLVPLLITRNEIINEEKVTVEEKNEK
ncbi:hypothetical protein HZA38_02980, partial [Candidatus Peregrinibacteria bacterium]|nr:hypothetical protein [Candidatus Peregrinibacteria bacterium]